MHTCSRAALTNDWESHRSIAQQILDGFFRSGKPPHAPTLHIQRCNLFFAMVHGEPRDNLISRATYPVVPSACGA